jgi:hypothetical protein
MREVLAWSYAVHITCPELVASRLLSRACSMRTTYSLHANGLPLLLGIAYDRRESPEQADADKPTQVAAAIATKRELRQMSFQLRPTGDSAAG